MVLIIGLVLVHVPKFLRQVTQFGTPPQIIVHGRLLNTMEVSGLHKMPALQAAKSQEQRPLNLRVCPEILTPIGLHVPITHSVLLSTDKGVLFGKALNHMQ